MIRTILVALDETPIATRVLATATEIAEHFDAHMVLFRAVMIPPEFPAAAAQATPGDPLPDHLAQEAREALRLLSTGNARAGAEPPVIAYGDPWRAIVATSNRLDADLVVVGSHLYHWPDHILGTVAGNLANRGTRNVLVVR